MTNKNWHILATSWNPNCPTKYYFDGFRVPWWTKPHKWLWLLWFKIFLPILKRRNKAIFSEGFTVVSAKMMDAKAWPDKPIKIIRLKDLN